MDNNKIKYGLKNVHYSVITENADGTYTYATPVAIRGAVNISMKSSFERADIAADDDPSYTSMEDNKGYTGEIEFEKVPDDFVTAVLGNSTDANGVMIENKDGKTNPIALLFEFDGDSKKTRHIFYYCRVTKPDVEGKTKGDKLENTTEKLSLVALPSKVNGNIKAKCTQGDSPYTNWYNSVYQETIGVRITPDDIIFDKKSANQQDAVINIIPSSTETLSKISNGSTDLTVTTHYTNTNNVVTIKKAYLATLNVGTVDLVFTFSDNSKRTLEVTVINS